jgi:hypothetical protein
MKENERVACRDPWVVADGTQTEADRYYAKQRKEKRMN